MRGLTTMRRIRSATMKCGGMALALSLAMLWTPLARARVPADIEVSLRKIGQIVDPACTAKLYRPLEPKNDFNTYWPPDAAAPGSTAAPYPGVPTTPAPALGTH